VAAGLLLGVNPIAGAVVVCVLSALSIEAIRKKLPRYAEMAIAITMSAGVGLAGVLSGFVKSSANFNSFLFGSIVAISDFELYPGDGHQLLRPCRLCAFVQGAFLHHAEGTCGQVGRSAGGAPSALCLPF
jgi:hypothetical protein